MIDIPNKKFMNQYIFLNFYKVRKKEKNIIRFKNKSKIFETALHKTRYPNDQ